MTSLENCGSEEAWLEKLVESDSEAGLLRTLTTELISCTNEYKNFRRQRLNTMMDNSHQETIQLKNTFNQQISQLDLSNNNILGEMKSIKDSVITTSNEINTMKEEINTAGQKIKKVLKKGNIQ
jgi:peptidoglycan hydrolase CwlO-like protein